MQIFSKNADSIKEELNIIKDSFITSKFKKIIDNIEMLEVFYLLLINVCDEYDDDAAEFLIKNKKYRIIKNQERRQLHKKFIQNFIDHKEFHNNISSKINDLYNREFNFYTEKSLYLKENQMHEIICDFLNDEFNQADSFNELINQKRLFRINNNDDSFSNFAGFTVYDFISKNNFIVVSGEDNIRDVELMRVLVHEFGHVVDNFNKLSSSTKDVTRYFWISSYSEVYSLLYEKLFYDYLINKNIFRNNTLLNLKQFYIDNFNYFNSLEYLSKLDDSLLINEKYKKDENIVDQIEIDENGMVSLALAIIDDFSDINKYSYGGLLANYFAELKHNDENEFNQKFEIFKSKRFNLFDPSLLKDLGTNTDDIVNIYSKGLDKITNKKLIFREY